MSSLVTASVRPDVDIQSDIDSILVHYPPLQQDRHHFQVRVQGGVVTITGHVRTPITRRYLLERLNGVADIVSVDAADLHTEEEIRLAAGRLVPDGVIVNMRYGTAILNGTLPAGVAADEIAANVASIPGVAKVVLAFE